MTNNERELIENNLNLIYGFCRDKFLPTEEWFSILAEAICKKIGSYDSTKSTVPTFFYLVMNTAVKSEYRARNMEKRKANSLSASIDAEVPGTEGCTLADTMEGSVISLEDSYICKEIVSYIVSRRTEKNYSIFIDYLNGMKQNDLKAKYKTTQPTISRAIKQVRKELVKEFDYA